MVILLQLESWRQYYIFLLFQAQTKQQNPQSVTLTHTLKLTFISIHIPILVYSTFIHILLPTFLHSYLCTTLTIATHTCTHTHTHTHTHSSTYIWSVGYTFVLSYSVYPTRWISFVLSTLQGSICKTTHTHVQPHLNIFSQPNYIWPHEVTPLNCKWYYGTDYWILMIQSNSCCLCTEKSCILAFFSSFYLSPVCTFLVLICMT